MHLIAASWLMTSLTASAALVALLLTAQSLPTFLLALPGGALADVLNRRRLIVVTQCWQAAVAAALAAATLADLTTPALLLAFTFALGAGAALSLPVLWAVIPELVPRAQLPAAVSLNSTSFTLAQAVGPTVGGLLVAAAGAGAVFVLNAVSFLGVAAVVASWRAPAPTSTLPAEHVGGAVRAGVRYVLECAGPPGGAHARGASRDLLQRASRPPRRGHTGAARGRSRGLWRATAALRRGWRARFAAVPRLRRERHHRLLPVAATVFAAMLLALATLESVAALLPLMLVGGAASMTVLSSFSIAAQSVLPGWVRGRGLAVYLLSFQAAMAAGAALWGALAANVGVSATLVAAGAGMIAAHLLGHLLGLRLAVADDVDLTKAYWTEPGFALEPELAEGPIRVEIEYRIAPEDTAEFLTAMRDLRRTRRRDGAMQWSVYQDLSDPERHVESFLVASWAEHERQHERAVRSDRAPIERVLSLQRGIPHGSRICWLRSFVARGRTDGH